jgi:uncharacterized protein YifE (UPF0438 family)
MQPQHPADHAALLARRDFVIPPGDFAEPERELLARYGRWLEALASGAVAPATPGQEQFVKVARGERDPETDFERVWVKVIQQRAVAVEVVRTFQALAQARADRSALEAQYTAARAAVLALVRDQLNAVDEEFAGRVAEAAHEADATEQAVRELVLRLGRSVNLAGIRATYSSPRVSWDNERMEAYAQHHPEVLAFRKLGKPFVALKFGDKDAPAQPGPAALPEGGGEAMKALPPEGGEG